MGDIYHVKFVLIYNEQGLKRRCHLKHYFILISGG